MVLSRNSAEAEDLIQETCLRALRGINRLRSGGSAKSWLFTILRNIRLNQLRHRRTAPDVVELDSDGSKPSEPVDSTQDPLFIYESKVEREQVRAAIQQLPVEFRAIIILREFWRWMRSSQYRQEVINSTFWSTMRALPLQPRTER